MNRYIIRSSGVKSRTLCSVSKIFVSDFTCFEHLLLNNSNTTYLLSTQAL